MIWHYNEITGNWEHSGPNDINIATHTITFTTGSFSPFALGNLALVPEPSTAVLAGLGLLSLGVVGWRRRLRCLRRPGWHVRCLKRGSECDVCRS